jgi:hypothetical protein
MAFCKTRTPDPQGAELLANLLASLDRALCAAGVTVPGIETLGTIVKGLL